MYAISSSLLHHHRSSARHQLRTVLLVHVPTGYEPNQAKWCEDDINPASTTKKPILLRIPVLSALAGKTKAILPLQESEPAAAEEWPSALELAR